MVDLYIIKKLLKRSSKQDLMFICFGVFSMAKNAIKDLSYKYMYNNDVFQSKTLT